MKDTKGQPKDMKTQADRAKIWIRRINLAAQLLKFEDRSKARDDALRVITETGTGLSGATYTDLNEGLPNFEDAVLAALPDMPAPDVELDFDASVVCPECDGNGAAVDEASGQELPCVLCGGDGEVPAYTDLKLEAYLRMAFKPHVGCVPAVVEEVLWDESTWGIGWAKAVWRMDFRPSMRAAYEAPDADDQLERAEFEIDEPEEREDDNHTLHLEQHRLDLERLTNGNPVDPRISQLQAHIEGYHEPGLEEIVLQFPELQHVPTGSLVYDPFARTWRDVRWYVELVTERVEAVKQAPGVIKANVIKENLVPNETAQGKELEDLSYDDALVDVLKIYDKANQTWIWLPAKPASGRGAPYDEQVKPILEAPWPYPNDLYIPLVMRRRPVKNSESDIRPLHGMSTAVLAEPILKELARINRAMRRHVDRHSAYKHTWPKGRLDTKTKAALNNAEQTIVEMPEGAGPGQEIKPPPIPETLLKRREILQNVLYDILGSDPQSTGAAFPHQITATESSARSVGQDYKVGRRQKHSGDFLSLVAMAFLELYRHFAPSGRKMPVPIDTPSGRQLVEFTPEDVPRGLRVQYDVAGTTPAARATKVQERQNYYTALLGSGVGDPRKIFDAWGRGIGERDPSRLFVDVQPVMDPNDPAAAGAPLAAVPGDGSPETGGPQPNTSIDPAGGQAQAQPETVGGPAA